MDYWQKLQEDVIKPGLCTQCGSCVGLSKGSLQFKEKKGIPLPVRVQDGSMGKECYEACPARFCNYPELNKSVFGKVPASWLSGVVSRSFIGHASDEFVRRNGASGGVITAVLIYLLESGKIDGAVCLKVGGKVPYRAEAVIARTKEEIIACAQSVYSVTPTNLILQELDEVEGKFAYVGLPDQVASIRKLQALGNKAALKIEYVLGPYMGTQMYFESIRSFLRSHGVKSEEEIVDLKYRAGEWPGYLQIKLRDGRILKAEKFYYNYLIPFFIASSSLQLVDFTNELCDISVGDAWSPKYEEMRGGHSVVLGRSEKGLGVLEEMQEAGMLTLEKVELSEALDMHGHMLDFKKRGSFIRNSWKKVQPEYGYRPVEIPLSRRGVELMMRLIFGIAGTSFARWTVEHLPLSIVGPMFNRLRKSWKGMSKPTKRKGLREMKFVVEE
jgi:coenzyme F420 hydrogenase subunit beta